IGPVMLISVGMNLKIPDFRTSWFPLCAVIAIKLVASPMIAVCVSNFFTWDPAWTRTAFVQEMGMPTMVMAWVISDQHSAGPDFVSAAIALTTILAPLTLWIWGIFI
ncbi:MAG: AEC family transporter, partial [Bdellovibrionota bacterium]